MRVARSFPHYPEVVCPDCGKKLSRLFSLEEHQRGPGCKARQNVRELMNNGWVQYSARAICELQADLSLGANVVREALIPEDELTIYRPNPLRFSTRGRGHVGSNIVTGYLVRDWLSMILDAYQKAISSGTITFFNDLVSEGMDLKFPKVLVNLVDQACKNESRRADVLAAIRLGGFRAAVDISKTWDKHI